MAGALGKLPAAPRKTDFKLKKFAVSLPPTPKRPFGYGTTFPDWGMLGNDYVGDCVFAGADHETMLYGKLGGHFVSFSSKTALSDYSAVTGYDPNNSATDQGTNVHDALSYRRSTGVVDVQGHRHKIDAYASIPHGDWNLMLRCVWTFGAVGIGFEVPGSAMDQFDQGQPWDDVGDTNIEGGHYVPIVGSQTPISECSAITWGRKQRMTKAFYSRYNDEAWVPLSREDLKAAGFNHRHILWADLNDALANL